MSQNDTKKYIRIKGARTHNLKNINLDIPKRKLIVLTGVSGSGKSSLAFDTLFSEGQRRYIESMSSYARQFLGKLKKPKIDKITGISPAIAVEQKVNNRNPRSTVGTSSEIYEYIKLLFSKIGKIISPISGEEVKHHSVSDVINFIYNLDERNVINILTRNYSGENLNEYFQNLLKKGFSRVRIEGKIERISSLLNKNLENKDIEVVFDRLTASREKDNISRMNESIKNAFKEGNGVCIIETENKQRKIFSNKLEADNIKFKKPSEELFSFNSPFGACDKCEGFGSVMGVDEDKVINNKSLSVYEGAVQCWKGEKLSKWKDRFISKSVEFDFPIHRPYIELNENEKNILWNGNKKIRGIYDFFKKLEKQNYKIQNRVILSRYRGKSTCQKCNGSRLKKEAHWIKVNNKNIDEIVKLSINESLLFFSNIKLSKNEFEISERLLNEIIDRLKFIKEMGLGYLTLNRLSSTLSGGESQRINLAKSISSSLVGSMYILDEPSIGLHSKDTKNLIKMLKKLRDAGNTVIVVEHDEEIIKSSDEIIDIGPKAGINGGEIIYQGEIKKIHLNKNSLTGLYLNEKLNVTNPKVKRKFKHYITINKAKENNLKNINVKLPLNCLTVISGVSGSGKSSLLKKIIYPAIQKKIQGYTNYLGKHEGITGNLSEIEKIEFIDQNPIGKSSRSNPATYMKAYDEIRNLFAKQNLSKKRNYKSGYFSFNTDGGRCEDCKGEGNIKIEMQFMADIELICESCHGKKFKEEILDVKFEGKNIDDILNMTVLEAINFFSNKNQFKISNKLEPLDQVGLGYINLGQASSTLSGGEAQRIKLASFLSKGFSSKKTLFLFDEPTTGLHFHDIKKLLKSFNTLIEHGHSIFCIEHNLDVIKNADWIIDLGPEGGAKGGELIFEGQPYDLIKNKKSHTGKYLKSKLS